MRKLADRSGELISGFSLIMIVIVILVSVISRTVFNYPLIWSGELSSMLIIWSIYSTFSTNYKNDTHFRIDVIDTFLSRKIVKILNLVSDVITMAALIILIIYSFRAIRRNINIRTAAMSVQVVYAFYLPFLLGCISFLISIFMKLYKHIRKNTQEE